MIKRQMIITLEDSGKKDVTDVVIEGNGISIKDIQKIILPALLEKC